MATRIYKINRGEQDFPNASFAGVTEGVGSATASKNIELTVDLAVSLSKEEVLLALEHFRNYILKGNWPPA